MTTRIEVTPIQTRRELEEFIAFPYRLHAAEPHWVPPLRMERRAFYDPERNPSFEYVRVRLFVARVNGRAAGTIAAIRNDLHGRLHPDERHVGFFGAFECRQDPAVADALVEAARAWALGEGFTVLRGPMNFTIMNPSLGVLVDGFDDDPPLTYVYNPPYYDALLEGAGFRKAKDLLSFSLDATDWPDGMEKMAAYLARRSRVRIRPLDLSRLEAETDLMSILAEDTWARHWGYTPTTLPEWRSGSKLLKFLTMDGLAFIAEVDGQTAGAVLATPDANEAIKLARGRLFPVGMLRLIWRLKVQGCSRLFIHFMITSPRFRGRGLDLLLADHLRASALRLGYRRAELLWVFEDDRPMLRFLSRIGARHTKTFRLYDRGLL